LQLSKDFVRNVYVLEDLPQPIAEFFLPEIGKSAFPSKTGATVVGNYGGEWPKARFRAGGVEYKLAEKHRGDLYLQSLPRITGKRVELLVN
jgi:hypothetical protein